MKTIFDIEASDSGFVVTVHRADGDAFRLHFHTVDAASNATRFLIGAFSQEALAAIEESSKRALDVIDNVIGKLGATH